MDTQIEISETELRRLYEQEGLSQREVAKTLGCSRTTIADRMREYGIQPRPPHVLPRFDITKHDLGRLYQDEKLSQEHIAAIYGCSQALVWLKMREYGIPSRSHAEAGILASGYGHLRRDFDWDQVTRAYYIGFCRGDIHARMRHERTLLRLFDLLEPYLKHAKRCQDMMRARASIEERNRRFGNRGM